MTGDPTDVATGWFDRSWDPTAGLLWNPPGAFGDATDGPRTVHLVRETAWYAIGLLRRDGPGDRQRALEALDAVLHQQYDEPGRPWHGTFVRFPEWTHPGDDAVEWVDYDPNWRQFVGSALAVAVTDFSLPAELDGRAREAVALAVAAEPPDRVPPTYANIALLRAWLDAWQGQPPTGYAAAVAAAFHHHDCFTEHGSPTYYGVDLLALGLWQRPDAPPELQQLGAGIEAALWRDLARWWHADLGNLCGPYTRAYGMDLHAYVSGLGLALWCADLPAPLPDLTADAIEHGHDLAMAPILQHVGVRVPHDARGAFERFPGEHGVTQVIDDDPARRATGWLGPGVAIGAEAGATGAHARGQFHPATVHWRLADGSVGWLRVEHHGPVTATASRGRLEVTCHPHPRHGPRPTRWVTNVEPAAVAAGSWSLPGLTVDVGTDAALTDPLTLTYTPPASGTASFLLRLS